MLDSVVRMSCSGPRSTGGISPAAEVLAFVTVAFTLAGIAAYFTSVCCASIEWKREVRLGARLVEPPAASA